MTVLLGQYGNRGISLGVSGVGGARLPACETVAVLEDEKALENFGDEAASAKVKLIGERWADPDGFF